MELTPRLALAARLCAGGRRLLDIGCDHGHLSIRLVTHGGFEGALACDLRAGPLARARSNLRHLGLEGHIETRLSDGLLAIAPEEGDTVAICGMGGELIAAILAASPWVLEGGHALVLQPQSKSEALRAFLHQRGCAIEREAIAREGERLYTVLRARGGGEMADEPGHFLFSKALMNDPLFSDYLDRLIARQRRALAGKQAGGRDFSAEAALLGELEAQDRGVLPL